MVTGTSLLVGNSSSDVSAFFPSTNAVTTLFRKGPLAHEWHTVTQCHIPSLMTCSSLVVTLLYFFLMMEAMTSEPEVVKNASKPSPVSVVTLHIQIFFYRITTVTVNVRYIKYGVENKPVELASNKVSSS